MNLFFQVKERFFLGVFPFDKRPVILAIRSMMTELK
jgi:hypothetical protein